MKRFLKNALLIVSVLFLSAEVFAAKPLIIDTDLGPDDWAAISYLMTLPKQYAIKAITVEGAGESVCQFGVYALRKALAYSHRTDIPIACDQHYGLYNTRFPARWRNPARAYFDSLDEKKAKNVVVWPNVPALMQHVLSHSRRPVSILAIGPFAGLASAIKLHRQLFINKVDEIYISGGALHNGQSISKDTDVRLFYRHLSPHLRTWNLFITPKAAEFVLQTPRIKFVFDPFRMQTAINGQAFVAELLAKKNSLNAYGQFILHVETLQDNYWGDVLTAAMMVHPKLCRYVHRRAIILYKNYPSSGVMVFSGQGRPVSICQSFDLNAFKAIFISAISH